jgi:hypothetical protein
LTVRAVWWLLKLVWRTTTAAGRWLRARLPAGVGVFDEMSGRLDTAEPRPRANLADFVEGARDGAWPFPALEVARISRDYARTFCGECGASSGDPSKRCPACVALLVKVLRELHGDEPGKMAEIARLAREGRL